MGVQPLGKRQGRILKDRADLGRKIPLTFLTAEPLAGAQGENVSRATTHARAGHSVGPPDGNEVAMGNLGARKVGDHFEEGLGLLVHIPSLRPLGAKRVALWFLRREEKKRAPKILGLDYYGLGEAECGGRQPTSAREHAPG